MNSLFSTLSFPGPTPTTLVQPQQVFPRLSSPSSSCSGPNEVVIKLSTTLVVSDYRRFYHGPIEQFKPTYIAMGDGSLVAPPYLSDLHNIVINGMLLGIFATVFARNTIISGNYITRSNAKKKIFFYLLFVSQLLGLAIVIPVTVGFLNLSVNCTDIAIVFNLLGAVSLNLLITGILGLKAYVCLNKSRIVLVLLVLFSAASLVISVWVAVHTTGTRTLTGACVQDNKNVTYVRVYLLIQLAEILFICLCFLSAVWASKDSPLIRGRMSIRLSMTDYPSTDDSAGNEPRGRRGWWDYTPKLENRDPSNLSPPQRSLKGIFLKIKHGYYTGSSPKAPVDIDSAVSPPSTAPSSVPRDERDSIISRSLRRYIPRVDLFRKVMQDELCFTALISVVFVVTTILSVVGSCNGTSFTMWILFDWLVISLLSVHSFGRVVRRNENVQAQTSYCRNAGHSGFADSRLTSEKTSTTRQPPSHRFPGRGFDELETRRLTHDNRLSWNSMSSVASLPSLVTVPTH